MPSTIDPDAAQEPVVPAAITVDATQGELREYWLARVDQHVDDRYAGVILRKFPEDLRTYEHLLWASRPDTVIELGTCFGGSALWFRDRLRTLRAYGRIERVPHVVSVDVKQTDPRRELAAADPSYEEEIDLVEADLTDPKTPERVGALVRPGARCLVVEDSAHVYETTRAALEGFARFVPPGGFFVVEDGCVDVEELRPDERWPRGVLPALDEWLRTPAGAEFRVRRDLELYGISCHPRGFLQRRGAVPADPPAAPAAQPSAGRRWRALGRRLARR